MPEPMTGIRSNWEVLRPLGSGGQSDVSLVRGLDRIKARTRDIEHIQSFSPWGSTMAETRFKLTGEFAEAVADYTRADRTSELGAMKVFKLREAGAAGEQQALDRLRQEILQLETARAGLPALLDHNQPERWMVTEFFPQGTLEANFARYKGNVPLALKAFLSLVKTVAALHAERIVHRDIKPANVFIRKDDELVLGDFGIVFLPDLPNRLTRTNESVGPHDYMPPWGNADVRSGDVRPSFDIYMLGKLLWCMVSGRLRLLREYFDRPEYDLTVQFGDDPAMYMINTILKRCVVETEKQGHSSANDLALIVSTYVQVLERGGQLLPVGVPRLCRVCGVGTYQNDGIVQTIPRIPKDSPAGLRLWINGSGPANLPVFPYVCDRCGHVEFFTRGATRPTRE
jgi:serine/threonine protein kinase